MAWRLNQTINYWTGNLNRVSQPIAATDLRPGDILLSQPHTVIFAGWDDDQHTRFSLYEQPRPGLTARYLNNAPYARYVEAGYTPYRYNHISDTSVSALTPHGPGGGPQAPGAAMTPLPLTPVAWSAAQAAPQYTTANTHQADAGRSPIGAPGASPAAESRLAPAAFFAFAGLCLAAALYTLRGGGLRAPPPNLSNAAPTTSPSRSNRGRPRHAKPPPTRRDRL